MRAIFFSISDSLEKKGLERGENGLCGVGKSMKVGGIQVSGGGEVDNFPRLGDSPHPPTRENPAVFVIDKNHGSKFSTAALILPTNEDAFRQLAALP